jgi:hypothetical protein
MPRCFARPPSRRQAPLSPPGNPADKSDSYHRFGAVFGHFPRFLQKAGIGNKTKTLTFGRHVDTLIGAMADSSNDHNQRDRQIVGFSLAPALAREVKSEAARRGLSLRKLFEELWELYKAQTGKSQ